MKPLVLVIEPDKDLLNNLTELLEISGYMVHSTTSISEIKSELLNAKPKAIIFDEMNLRGTYNKVAKELEYENKKAKPVIIVLNDMCSTLDFEYADDCISLPFLGESITDLLNKKLKAA
jgi:DNA-binding response OmpR family regulator